MIKTITKTNPEPAATNPRDPGAVSITAIVKVYRGKNIAVSALKEVSLEVASGEFVAIMGPSGSGKTTLLYCAAGLDRIDRGQVSLLGSNLASLSDSQLSNFRRQNCGFVFQAYNLVPTLNALENICLPNIIAGRLKKDSEKKAKEIAGRLGLSNRLNHRAADLSGGQQQRVAVARALINQPKIVFADEPTGNLDSQTAQELMVFLKEVSQRQNQAILMVTHEPTIASQAQRVVFLRDGQIVDQLKSPTSDSIYQKMRDLDN